MRRAIYPGTFDPITLGHIDIIERSSKLFDEVIILIMSNSEKKCLFTEEQRFQMLLESTKHLGNVKCDIGTGLTVNYAKKAEAQVLIRGIRAVQDYEYELATATANMWLDPNIETMFLLAKPNYSFLSSSSVKEMAKYQGDVSQLVSPFVANLLKEKFTSNK